MALRIIQIVLITYAVVVGTIIIRDFIKNREKDMSVKMQVAHYILGLSSISLTRWESDPLLLHARPMQDSK